MLEGQSSLSVSVQRGGSSN